MVNVARYPDGTGETGFFLNQFCTLLTQYFEPNIGDLTMSNPSTVSSADNPTGNSAATETVILNPDYRVPLGVAVIGVGLAFLSIWVGAVVGVLAGFLALQATILRLHFTPTAMELYRNQQLIRQFPYDEWLNWQLFWPPLPILFYFREIKSIHFVPILFSPATLQACLSSRSPLPLQK
jgi:Protein of unknown function (DUF3119)